MKKFWNWIHDDSGGRTLRLEGPIDNENFWGDEITPQEFRSELESEEGDVTVWINSPGGNVFAAAEIYTMLREYKGSITVRIASIAASAASVVAMAGDRVEMSPTALLMIHDPITVAMGNAKDMEKAIETLGEVKESIINAYAAKSGMRRTRIADLMSNETWMNAKKAVEMGFADVVLYEDEEEHQEADDEKAPVALDITPQIFSSRMMDQAILNRLGINEQPKPGVKEPVIGMDGTTEDGAVPYQILMKQLDFLK